MVDRFKLLNHGMCDMCEEIRHPDGDMVEYDDYKNLLVENTRLEGALALSMVNKDRAEDQERLRRVEIDRLNAIIVDAKERFDDIASEDHP